jgi:hypothetical protein
MPKIKDSIFHLILISFLLFISFFPLYRKNQNTPPNTTYTFIQQYQYYVDYFYYLSIIRQGRNHFEAVNQYTSENNYIITVHPFYLALGKIADIISVSDIDIYYLSKLTSFILFYFFSFKLISLFFPENNKLWAMFIIFLAAPLPPIHINLYGIKMFIRAPEWTMMSPYLRLIYIPHHFFGITMSVISLYYLIRFYQVEKWHILLLSIMFLLLCLITYIIPGLILVTALMVTIGYLSFLRIITLYRKGRLSELLNKISTRRNKILGILAIIFSCLIFIYLTRIQLIQNSRFGAEIFFNTEYKYFLSEHDPYLFILFVYSFGLLPFFSLFALPRIFIKASFKYLLIFFIFFTPLILYFLSLTSFLQISKIRFAHNATYLYGGILSIMGMEYILNYLKKTIHKKIFSISVILIFLCLFILDLKTYWYPQVFEKETVYLNSVYIQNSYYKIFDYFNNFTPPYSAIISQRVSSEFLPAFTHNKIFLGHALGTIDYFPKLDYSKRFFSGNMDEKELKELFRRYNLKYVLMEQSALPQNYSPFFRKEYSSGNLTIYKYLI